jgi:hypothetical protein
MRQSSSRFPASLWLIVLVACLGCSREPDHATQLAELDTRLSKMEGREAATRARMTASVMAHLDSLHPGVPRASYRLLELDRDSSGACITVAVAAAARTTVTDSVIALRVARDGRVDGGTACSVRIPR